MIMDDKGRLFGKISIIDILIVLVVVAGIAGVAYKFTASKAATPFAKADDIQIQFYSEESPTDACSAIKSGDAVVDPVKNSSFGTVSSVKLDKSISWAQSDKGEFVASTKTGYSSIYLTADGKGAFGNSGVKFGTDYYYIGKTMELRVGNSAFWVRISDIKKKG